MASNAMIAALGVAIAALSLLACGGPPTSQGPVAIPPAGEIDPAALRAALAATPSSLDPDVVPVHYALMLEVDPAAERLGGRIDATLDVAAAVDSFVVHACDTVDITASVVKRAGTESRWTAEPGPGHCEVTLSGARLAAGEHVLSLEFESAWGTERGIFRFEVDGARYVASHMGEAYTRETIPLFDEPALKVPFDIIIDAPREQVVATNTPLAERPTTSSNGLMRHRFRTSPPMPSYLLAIAVGPWDVLDIPPAPELESTGGRAASVPVRVLTVRGTDGWRPVSARIRPLLAALEAYTAIAYPYRKLDVAIVPVIDTIAMENPGLIYAIDWSMRLDARSTTEQRRFAEWVMAHELAHMWFGNLVTMRWWDGLWLNEAFATWLASKVIDRLSPDYRQPLADAKDRAAMLLDDASGLAPAVSVPVDGSPASIATAFTLQPYYKGAPMLRGIERRLGETAFRNALRTYLRAEAWGTAGRRNLTDAFGTALEADPTLDPGRLERWLDAGLDRGAPLVAMDWACDGDQLTVDTTVATWSWQGVAPAGPAAPWALPICIAYGTDDRSTHCFDIEADGGRAQIEVDICPTWVHPQVGEGAYYTWAMDASATDALIDHFDILTEAERAALPDQLTWAWAGGAIDRAAFLSHAIALADSPAFEGPVQKTLARQVVNYQSVLGEHAGTLARRIVASSPVEDRALADLRVHVLGDGDAAQFDTEVVTALVEGRLDREPDDLSERVKRVLAVAPTQDVSAFIDAWGTCSPWSSWNLAALRAPDTVALAVSGLAGCREISEAWHETLRWNPVGAAAVLDTLDALDSLDADRDGLSSVQPNRARTELRAGALAALCRDPRDVATALARHGSATLPDSMIAWNAHCHALSEESR